MSFSSFGRPLLLGLVLLLFAGARPAPADGPPRLREGQSVPPFITTDVLGRSITAEGLRGQRVLLSFMRDAGCPICELRLARLASRLDSLTAAHTRVVLVYESDAPAMRQYLADKDLPFTFVADGDGVLDSIEALGPGGGDACGEPFCAQSQTRHLPAHGGRAVPDGPLRLQAEDEGVLRQGPS